MHYVNYIGNVTRVAVELVNGDPASGLLREMYRQHEIEPASGQRLEQLLPDLREAVEAVADGGPITPVNTLLARFPPDIHVSDHDAPGEQHLHFARNGEDAISWLGRYCAAALAHVICGDPDVTVGRCQAAGCQRFYVDDSRNRSRRFCSNACASRTTVAAYRARRKAGEKT
ncbi:MAG TPA: CGNR zinc finger domain-containing protein [Trebonia sp.]